MAYSNDIYLYVLRFINNIARKNSLVLLIAMVALDQSSIKVGFVLISYHRLFISIYDLTVIMNVLPIRQLQLFYLKY